MKGATRYAAAALASETVRCVHSPRGSRHLQLYVTSRRIGELVAGGEIEFTHARSRLVEIGRRMKPDALSEVLRTVDDGLKKGMTAPRSSLTSSSRPGVLITSRSDAVLAIWRFAELILSPSLEWDSRTGGSDQRVLLALCLMALNSTKVCLGVSVRQISELSGLGVATVHRSLGRIEGRFISHVHVGSQRRSNDRSTLRLLVGSTLSAAATTERKLKATSTAKGASVPSLPQPDTSSGPHPQTNAWKPSVLPLGEFSASSLAHPQSPLWRRRSTAWRIFVALLASSERVTASELSNGLSIPLRTVRSNLAWLEDAGVLDSDRDAAHVRRFWALSVSRAEVEVSLCLPSPELRRARHRLDRARHRLRLQASASFGAFRSGGITAAELEQRRQALDASTQALRADAASLSMRTRYALSLARSHELSRRGLRSAA